MNTRGQELLKAGDGHTPTCKRKEEEQQLKTHNYPKKPRLVFTDLQRRTLQAIFKETKRPSKEIQITVAQQLGLQLNTVGNFFMNARRRSHDKWLDEDKSMLGREAVHNTYCHMHGMKISSQSQLQNSVPTATFIYASPASIITTS
ncbi:hepatocyte nuclear factor 6-like [Tachypleus tridentatus]|uniref:hepatocyte nuclear factor 6-like n=1 Tax=Tachypleus tridentatus TaxID=6853 RepID=UPI003FCF2F35